MATWADVRRLALALPETSERPSYDGRPAWSVKDKLFAWERPLRPSDLRALGAAAPKGAILGLRTADLETKDAMLQVGMPFFSTPHFDGYPAILVLLAKVRAPQLRELLRDAWLARAPKRVRAAYLDASG